jgi:capsular exopolysaccharide synthesis family protein
MSSDMQQQITPFDGYGGEAAEFNGPGSAGLSTTALARATPYTGQPGLAPYDPSMGGGGQQQAQVFKKIHQSLRGRYFFAIGLGLVLGIAGGYAGWKSQKPLYRGESLVQIRMEQKIISGNQISPHFEELMQSETLTISSRGMIKNAMRGKDWALTGMPTDSETQSEVVEHLGAEHPARTEYIKLHYTDPDPHVAAAVVRAVTNAYWTYFHERSSGEEYKRLKLMQDQISLLQSDINKIDRDILQISQEWSTHNLDGIWEKKMEMADHWGKQLMVAEVALQQAKSREGAAQAVLNWSTERIANFNPRLAMKLAERDELKKQMGMMELRGFMKENQQVKLLERMIQDKSNEIDGLVADWRDMMKWGMDDPTFAHGAIGKMLAMTPKVLEQEVATLTERAKKAQDEMKVVGQGNVKLKELLKQRDEKMKQKTDQERRQEIIALDAKVGTRLNVIYNGEWSSKPVKDRRKMMAAAGTLFGFGLPVGVFVLMGLADRRYRYTDDAGESVQNVPLLGILPRLPDKLTDPEQAAVAAHCIHQIRIMLQVGADPESRRVFMITSASTGDGKTSLTMALGLSFAASGSKTLVIDCDMVGQGLTHRLKAHNVPGLIETLNLGTLRGHVRKTGTKGLYVLPIGCADAVHAGLLSPQSIRRLLAACREHFDVIVIDTGPILGSLEASVVAPESDGVVLAVARGQQQPLVERSIKMLRTIGGNVLGIVFNRAEQRDFARSVASASIRSLSARPSEARPLLPESDENSRFGPLARSVASCLPSSSGSNGNGHAAHGNGSANGNGAAIASTPVSAGETRG